MSYCLAMTKSILSNRKLTLDFAFAFTGMISANCQPTKRPPSGGLSNAKAPLLTPRGRQSRRE